jgi:hypothetical protein
VSWAPRGKESIALGEPSEKSQQARKGEASAANLGRFENFPFFPFVYFMSCALFDWREKGGNLSVETEFMTSSIQRKEGLSISIPIDVTKRESYLFINALTPDSINTRILWNKGQMHLISCISTLKT